MNKIEHIGIAVKNLEESNALFAKLLGQPPYKIELVESEGVRTSFFDVGGVKIELLEATRPDSPIATFLEKKGEGVHHIAFEAEPMQQKLIELKQQGFTLLAEQPKPGADNKEIVFLHPRSTNGVLVELCQERK
jgi:methylmalonyl-CoA/ethylmalonyl-CoA epimerase